MNSLFYFIKGELKKDYERIYNLLTKYEILECMKNKKELNTVQYNVYRLLDNGINHYILNSLIYMNVYSNFIQWKIEYIQMNYRNINLLYMQNRLAFLFKRAITNPNYYLCKQRLMKEYSEIMN